MLPLIEYIYFKKGMIKEELHKDQSGAILGQDSLQKPLLVSEGRIRGWTLNSITKQVELSRVFSLDFGIWS